MVNRSHQDDHQMTTSRTSIESAVNSKLLKQREIEAQDEARLRQLGYKQELSRSLSLLSTLGLAFTILSIPTSLLPFLHLGLGLGGPQGMIGSWLIVSFFSVLVGLTMSEIASAYPTSGGLYFWAASLSPKGYAPFISFFTGWFNFVGLWGITAGTAYDIGEQFASTLLTLGLVDEVSWPEDGIKYRSVVVGVACLGLLIAAWVCTLNTKTLDIIGQISLYLNVIGILGLAGTVGLSKQVPHVSISDLFQSYYNNTSFSAGYVWIISLLPATVTYTGFDSAGHMAEETKGASESGPKAIMLSILMSIPIGFFTLWAFLGAIPPEEYGQLSEDAGVAMKLLVRANGKTFGLVCIYFLMILSWTCSFGLIATHCRMTYAFSRDGGLPFSKWLYKLNDDKIPVRSLIMTTGLNCLILFPCLISEKFNIPVNSMGTIGTYVSYLIPLGLRLWKGSSFRGGPFYLKKPYGTIVAFVAVLWLLLASIALMLPTSSISREDYSDDSEYLKEYWSEFNYASIMVGFLTLISLTMWLFSARFWFKGPHCVVDEEDGGTGTLGSSDRTLSMNLDLFPSVLSGEKEKDDMMLLDHTTTSPR